MPRNVRIEYDCEHCGAKRISSETRQTDEPDEELLKLRVRAVCPNPWCKSEGRLQEVRAARIVAV